MWADEPGKVLKLRGSECGSEAQPSPLLRYIQSRWGLFSGFSVQEVHEMKDGGT